MAAFPPGKCMKRTAASLRLGVTAPSSRLVICQPQCQARQLNAGSGAERQSAPTAQAKALPSAVAPWNWPSSVGQANLSRGSVACRSSMSESQLQPGQDSQEAASASGHQHPPAAQEAGHAAAAPAGDDGQHPGLTREQLSSKRERGADRPEGLKRTVGMHVGYVGTAFRGERACTAWINA